MALVMTNARAMVNARETESDPGVVQGERKTMDGDTLLANRNKNDKLINRDDLDERPLERRMERARTIIFKGGSSRKYLGGKRAAPSSRRYSAAVMGEVVVGGADPRVIRCEAAWKTAWDWFVIGLIMYNAILVPWEFSFQRQEDNTLNGADYFVDVLFLADTVMCFFTSFVDSHGVEVLELPEIRSKYLRGFFPIDVAALFPFELIVRAAQADVQLNLLQLIKLPRLLRLSRLMRRLDTLTHANALRVIKLLFGFFLFAHWIACAWFFLGRYQAEGNVWTGSVWLVENSLCQTVRGEGYVDEVTGEYILLPPELRAQEYLVQGITQCIDREDHWQWHVSGTGDEDEPYVRVTAADGEEVLVRPEASALTQYVTSIYWSLTTLTTVGYGDVLPTTNAERLFTVMVMLFGAIIYASIFGNVAVLIQSFDMAQARYQDRINHLKEFCSLHEVTYEAQERMLRYADRIYLQTHGFSVRDMLAEFPSTLRGELILEVHRDFVKNLKHASPYVGENTYFLQALLLRLNPQVCLSGDYVIRKGDAGHHTYFIKFGALEVVMDDKEGCSSVGSILIGAGEHFGEATLFKDKRRSTSVRARVFSELFYLDRTDFKALRVDFPREVNVFVQVAIKRIGAAQASLEQRAGHDRRVRDESELDSLRPSAESGVSFTYEGGEGVGPPTEGTSSANGGGEGAQASPEVSPGLGGANAKRRPQEGRRRSVYLGADVSGNDKSLLAKLQETDDVRRLDPDPTALEGQLAQPPEGSSDGDAEFIDAPGSISGDATSSAENDAPVGDARSGAGFARVEGALALLAERIDGLERAIHDNR